MLNLSPAVRIYLATGPVDLRRGIDGLMGLVRQQGIDDVYAGHLFVFVGRDRSRLKALWFDRGGFVLLTKRLERCRFRVPDVAPGCTSVRLSAADLAMLLEGLDFTRVKRPPLWEPRRDRPGAVAFAGK